MCVPWNNAGDCIPPRKTHCSHYCISILIWCKMYCDITYCITICMCSGFGIQYSYSVSCTVYCNTIFLCSVFVGREYNIHMSAPQWGAYFTFYTALQPTLLSMSSSPSFLLSMSTSLYLTSKCHICFFPRSHI